MSSLKARLLLPFAVLSLGLPIAARAAADGSCPDGGGVLASIGDAARSAAAAIGILPSVQPPIVEKALPEEVETLVIGSGPGGGVVATELANAGQTVALLDAGKMQALPVSLSLAAFGASTEYPAQELAYQITRIPGQADANYPRLQGPAGASGGAAGIITPFLWSSLDGLAKDMGDPSLSPQAMAPYLRKIEDARYDLPGRVAGALGFVTRHGHSGLQKTGLPGLATLVTGLSDLRQLLPLYGAIFGSTQILPHLARGFDLHDPAVQATEGPIILPAATAQDGTRSTVAQAIQATQEAHPDKLFVKGEVLVDRLTTEKGPDGSLRVTGAVYYPGANLLDASPLANGAGRLPAPRTIRAKRVVLASSPWGVVGTLVRSGIGPKADLKKLGVTPVLDLPGVSKRVSDRLETTLQIEMPKDFKTADKIEKAAAKLQDVTATVLKSPADPKANRDFRRAWEAYRGVLATNGIPAGMLWKSDPSLKAPDLLFIAFPGNFTNFRKGFSKDLTARKNIFSIIMLKIDTASTGTATVSTTDPRVPPKINVDYDPQGPDFQAMAKGVLRFNQEVGPRLPKGAKIITGKADNFDQALGFLSNKDHIFGHHVRGGAAMGPESDPLAVVDSRQKVYGTENLYVAGTATWDRSVGPFPIMPIEALSARLADILLAGE